VNFNLNRIVAIKGDASFRKFFRKKNKNKATILVFANKEKEKNLLIYDAINKLLIKNKIIAPKLYEENYRNNYIEIEDLGNNTLFDVLNRSKKEKIKYFKKIIKVLIKIQKIKQKKIKNFKKKKLQNSNV